MSVVFPYLMDAHDVWVLEAADRLGLGPEPLFEVVAGEGTAEQHLERDGSIQSYLSSEINDSHSPTGDLF